MDSRLDVESYQFNRFLIVVILPTAFGIFFLRYNSWIKIFFRSLMSVTTKRKKIMKLPSQQRKRQVVEKEIRNIHHDVGKILPG